MKRKRAEAVSDSDREVRVRDAGLFECVVRKDARGILDLARMETDPKLLLECVRYAVITNQACGVVIALARAFNRARDLVGSGSDDVTSTPSDVTLFDAGPFPLCQPAYRSVLLELDARELECVFTRNPRAELHAYLAQKPGVARNLVVATNPLAHAIARAFFSCDGDLGAKTKQHIPDSIVVGIMRFAFGEW